MLTGERAKHITGFSMCQFTLALCGVPHKDRINGTLSSIGLGQEPSPAGRVGSRDHKREPGHADQTATAGTIA